MTDIGRIAEVQVRETRVSERTLWRYVVLTTEAGVQGIGEATFEAAPADMSQRLQKAGNALIGCVPSIEALPPLNEFPLDGMADATIYSALEQALMDLIGQRAGEPCFRLLRHDAVVTPIALYANINRRTQSRLASDFATNALAAQEEGFQAIKLAPFDGLTPEACGTPAGESMIATGLERIEAVAAVLTSTTELQIDCHWRFSPSRAASLIAALAERNVRWFECPIPETIDNVKTLARLRAEANAANMRLAGLENLCAWERFKPFVERGCYDVIMPDIKHCGGYQAMLEIAGEASRCGVAVSPHNPSGPICHQASVHAATAIGGSERLEIQWRETPLFERLTSPAAKFDNALSQASDLPGLGMTLNDR